MDSPNFQGFFLIRAFSFDFDRHKSRIWTQETNFCEHFLVSIMWTFVSSRNWPSSYIIKKINDGSKKRASFSTSIFDIRERW